MILNASLPFPAVVGPTAVGQQAFPVGGSTVKNVYETLAEHQQTESWDLQDFLRELRRWVGIFDLEFKLQVPQVSLCVDWLRRRVLGHFRPGHNGFGLRGEVAINRRHLTTRPFWQVLGTLLRELLHAWQQAHGRPGRGNYHNMEFRAKARGYGLIIDERGVTQYEPDSHFVKLLAKHGIQVPAIPVPSPSQRGTSKLKKWSCGCTNVRVAVADFRAVCMRCGHWFERAN